MCVTNTTSRRAPTVSLFPANAVVTNSNTSSSSVSTAAPSDLSKRLAAAFPPRVQNACPYVKPTVTKKRRRKPQQPGFTAKHNQRHFVVHNYRDHALERDDGDETHIRKGGVAVAFPLKLHAVLDQVEADGLGHVISWQPHGRCFVIHQPKVFVASVMPK